MRYAQIRKLDISNGEGIGVALFTQGCPYHCKNCFNPETWDFAAGQEWTEKEENLIIELLKPSFIKRITVLGGEPLIERNIKPLVALLSRVKATYPKKKIWLYTGGNFDSDEVRNNEILKYVDILIDGKYDEALRDLKLKWRGSSNQRIIDVQESLKKGEVVLYL